MASSAKRVYILSYVVFLYFIYKQTGAATVAALSILFLWVEALIWGNAIQDKRIKALEAAVYKGENNG